MLCAGIAWRHVIIDRRAGVPGTSSELSTRTERPTVPAFDSIHPNCILGRDGWKCWLWRDLVLSLSLSLSRINVVVAMERGRLVETIVHCSRRRSSFGRASQSAVVAARIYPIHPIHRSGQPAFPTVTSRKFTTRKDNNNTLLPHGSPPQPLTTIYVHPLSQLVLASLQSNGHEWILRHELDRCLTIHRDGTFVLEPKPQEEEERNDKLLPPDTVENQTCTTPTTTTTTTTSSTTTTTTSSSFTSTEATSTTKQESLQPKSEATNLTKESNTAPSDDDNAVGISTVCSHAPQRLRIWTSYDPLDKKHWLSVQLAAPPANATWNQENDQTSSSSSNHHHHHHHHHNVLVRRFLLQDNLLPAWHGGGASRHKSLPERIQEMVNQVMILVDDNCHMTPLQRQQQQQPRGKQR